MTHEAEILGRLSGAGIPELLGCGIEGQHVYLAAAFVPGETLEQRLARGPLDLEDFHTLAASLLLQLDRVHRAGVLHRDLKPSNLVLAQDGGVTLIDFGFSRCHNLTEGGRDLAVGSRSVESISGGSSA